jgi:hypothetical protein
LLARAIEEKDRAKAKAIRLGVLWCMEVSVKAGVVFAVTAFFYRSLSGYRHWGVRLEVHRPLPFAVSPLPFAHSP